MCGIAGYFGTRPPDECRIQTCLSLMARRGPDALGTAREVTRSGRQAILFHSRLAIIDRRDCANQPMRRGRQLLTVNGQLFNYHELRSELAQAGATFATESDTEVLLEQLSRKGLDGLDVCEGMWAFSLYDVSGILTLCRDRFGEKPLYVFHASHGVYWGSEIKYIRSLAIESINPDLEHVRLFIAEGYKAVCGRSRTFWNQVVELPAGTAWTYQDAPQPTSTRYWNPSFDQDESMSLDDAVEGVRHRLDDSVRMRLRADVPIAFCMSSGVDSNALIGLARKKLGQDVHGFTISTSDPRYEEVGLARRCADQIGIRHTAVPCETSGFLDGLAALVQQHDAPVLTVSYYLHWLVMRAMATDGYRVSISGTGADELLTGYYEHHNLWLDEPADAPELATRHAAWETHIRPQLRNNAMKYNKASPARVARALADGYLIDSQGLHQTGGNYTASPVRNRMLNELFLQVVPPILHEDDLNAMYYSVENRSPFLDRRLTEFCFRIPTRHLIQDAYAKYPLRKAMSGLVPDFILWNRRKVGFNGSTREFINTHSPAVVATILDSPAIFEIVRRDAVERLLGVENHTDDENKLLFSIISAQSFLQSAHQN